MEQAEFTTRRQHLLQHIPPQSMVLISAASEQQRSNDVDFPFRQNSNFYYLTGFHEPHAIALLIFNQSGLEYILFCQPKDPQQELWHGKRVGLDMAKQQYGADKAYNITEFDQRLPELLEGISKVYYPFSQQQLLAPRLYQGLAKRKLNLRDGHAVADTFVDLESIIHEQRLIKRAEEVQTIKQVCELSAQAHCRAMQTCRPGLYEYHLAAEIQYAMQQRGAQQFAYPPIIGGGANACILHYTENTSVLTAGDLVLIDAGAELENYAADITRTFPVNGKFSPQQKALYEIVLAAQLAAIAEIYPGNPWQKVETAAVAVITKGLVRLQILQGDVDELVAASAYRKFYMHKIGHWLGLDVHDVGAYKVAGQWRELQPGMLMTVEPGIYIAADSVDVDPQWWNIGIRIEDDVLVTTDGHEVLSHAVPKEIAEIEALMAHV